jgi:hypothetical protein
VRSMLLAAVVLLVPAAGHAQSTEPSRQMPSYQDDSQGYAGGYQDSYGTADTHHHVDQTPPPPPVPDGYGGGYNGQPGADGWKTPAPYARADQVDQGSPDDAAHRADRARTAALNRRNWPGRNAAPTPTPQSYSGAHAEYREELDQHARDMQDYRAEQARYAERIARWRARANACEAGNTDACEGPND